MEDPKPGRRYRASADEWTNIRLKFRGQKCWGCGNKKWVDLHHVYPRGQGGDDATNNLVPLCRECHTKVELRIPETRARIRLQLTPAHHSYLVFKLGEAAEAWLDRHYAFTRCRLCGEPSKGAYCHAHEWAYGGMT